MNTPKTKPKKLQPFTRFMIVVLLPMLVLTKLLALLTVTTVLVGTILVQWLKSVHVTAILTSLSLWVYVLYALYEVAIAPLVTLFFN